MARRAIKRNRIQQGDICILALELAAARRNRWISTTDLKNFMIDKFKPTDGDAVLIANGRAVLFDQIVGNLISNRNTDRSMFKMGYAVYENGGIRITDRGLDFLDTVPR